jgi:2-keto-4-pentenoate hydratase/2-oxohepta-3-ene-1,7-dioic acid hydratase in catechol pathway
MGLDMTLRNLQSQLKKAGHPWDVSKTFKHSVILCKWIPIADFKNYLDEPFEFYVDGALRQKSCGKKMRLSPKDCILYAAEYFPICEGDIIMTGTPEGMGPILPSQTSQIKWGHLNQRLIWS